MAKKPSRPRDANQLAHLIVGLATGESQEAPTTEKASGQVRGGMIGGKARAEKLTPEKRSEIAKKAAKARWDKA